MTPEWPDVPRPEPLPSSTDLPCGAVLPYRPDDPDADAERLGLCVDDSPCGRDAHYAVETADGREVAICGQHRPSGGGYERERSAADGGRDGLPSDPFDRSPDDYDVSDHPAAEPPADGVDRGDGPVADGGLKTRVGHVRHDDVDVYAGRASESGHLGTVPIGDRGWLGNPFTLDKFNRDTAISLYRAAFQNRLVQDDAFRAAVRDLAGSVLGCWCQRLDEDAPACHAEVVARAADRLADPDTGERVVADGGAESFAPVTDEPRPDELARELQQKAAVRAAHPVRDCYGAAVEIVLPERFDAVPARVARPIYRRGFAISDTSWTAGRSHLQVTARPGEGSA